MRRLLSGNNFPKFVVGTSLATGLACYVCFLFAENRNPSSLRSSGGDANSPSRAMSGDEALVRAMIENAKESSWQENLANALDAHERFVLPGQQGQAQPEFVDKIVERSDRMIEEQRHRQREKERKRQEAGGGHENFSTSMNSSSVFEPR